MQSTLIPPRAPAEKEVIGEEAVERAAATRDAGLLPDFCRGEMVLRVVVLAELLAIVFAIVTPPITASILNDLALLSLFVQWIALLSVGALCLARPYLNRLPDTRALLFTYAMLLCITWFVGESGLWLLAAFDYLDSPRPEWHLRFHAQNLIVSAIINAMALRYFVARDQLLKSTQAAERARAQILRHRIRPHFLFNSMNIIASLTRRAPARAESAIEDMADLFRLMLDERKELVSIPDEIKIAKKYLQLEKLRLESRVNATWRLEGVTRQAKTPVLMLQMLLENAIRNGIEYLPEGGDIDVSILVENETAQIVVTSPAPPGEVRRNDEARAALDNIRLRLKDLFGEDARVDVVQSGGRFSVEIRHPAFRGGLTQ